MKEHTVSIDIARSLGQIRESIGRADAAFDRLVLYGEHDEYAKDNLEWHLDAAFLLAILVAEATGLSFLKQELESTYTQVRKESDKSRMGPDEPYSVWVGYIRQRVEVLEALFNVRAPHSVTLDIEEIIRSANYSIHDKGVFPIAPRNEDDVHRRIEAVLRCVFTDLLHKPRLSKPIKSFEPDTGLPSASTLIEYKFAASPADVKRIADEILTDSRGYHSKDWSSLVYVVYEARRLRPEGEWNRLLRECAVPETMRIIVLSGESATKRRKSTQRREWKTPPRRR